MNDREKHRETEREREIESKRERERWSKNAKVVSTRKGIQKIIIQEKHSSPVSGETTSSKRTSQPHSLVAS